MLNKLVILILSLLLVACSTNTQVTNDSFYNSETNSQTSTSTSQDTQNTQQEPSMTDTEIQEILKLEEGQQLFATIKTSLGDIKLELYPDKAPVTVANFVGLSEGTKNWQDPRTGQSITGQALYKDLIFHRVIKDFMIQGGDPLGTGTGGPGYRFEDETDNGLTFDTPGLLAMANSGPNTNGSQFFITQVPTPHLNGRHTIFGKVVEGMEVVNNIANVATGTMDRPVEDVTLDSITIERQ